MVVGVLEDGISFAQGHGFQLGLQFRGASYTESISGQFYLGLGSSAEYSLWGVEFLLDPHFLDDILIGLFDALQSRHGFIVLSILISE